MMLSGAGVGGAAVGAGVAVGSADAGVDVASSGTAVGVGGGSLVRPQAVKMSRTRKSELSM